MTRTRSLIATVALTLLGMASAVASENDLLQLYENVKKRASAESQHNAEREQRFLESAERRNEMLNEVRARIARLESRKGELKETYDGNEERLAEISAQLDQRVGDLGELFGVFRQTADDAQGMLFDSLITLEHPERRAAVKALADSDKKVPAVAEMRELWRLLTEEIALSGQLSEFEASVVSPGGREYETSVTRVGMFNVVTEDKYLNYLSESQSLVELPRQPAGHVRATAERLTSAEPGERVGFALDPSRGALLGMLVQSPSIVERIQQGKSVGYAIIGVAIIGLLIVLQRWMRLTIISQRIRRQQNNLDQVSNDNPLGRIMLAYYENEHLDDLDVISRKLEQVVIEDVADVRKGLATIKVLAAIAPLMGLLGTVTGMIGTFQAITLFGTGDPKLMAGGISQALITTVLGLCAAIPLLLAHSLLNSRATWLSKIIGEQAAGMMAAKAEALASGRQKRPASGGAPA